MLLEKNTTLLIYYMFSKVASSPKLKHGSQPQSLKIYKLLAKGPPSDLRIFHN